MFTLLWEIAHPHDLTMWRSQLNWHDGRRTIGEEEEGAEEEGREGEAEKEGKEERVGGEEDEEEGGRRDFNEHINKPTNKRTHALE